MHLQHRLRLLRAMHELRSMSAKESGETMTNLRADGNIAAKDQARTPPEIFRKLDEEFHFDCDAAANDENSLCGDNWLQNALEDSWMKWGWKTFFVNPPYSAGNIPRFVEKAWLESSNGATVVLLIPSDPSTQYFDFCFNNAAEIRFMQPRVKFNNPYGTPMKSSPPMGSMIVVFGPNEDGPAKISIWRWKE
jgi:phage N-6-adenine-methyltransferase